jgi:predicted aspartyl protease
LHDQASPVIRGVVNSGLEAVVRLRVRRPGHPGLDVDLVVDSGFSSSLTLPFATVAALGLVRQSSGGAMLADGSYRQLDVYAAEVGWDGGWRPVLVYALDSAPLLGMQLIASHELRISVVPGGAVEIIPIP